ncbi:MAG: 3-hydroxyacyl-CoA dehydrogenase family protein [Deltaproteobacteria bacterium]|nr:3-hydroxyacyl-CoA dehydrogenase family protein [Deltaproteobacteria bacterium]
MAELLKNVAIIGGGMMGTQIALIATHFGYRVRVFDTDTQAFDNNLEKVRSHIKARVSEPYIPWDQWPRCIEAINRTTDLQEALEGAELVIEAVPENLELKRRVFRELGQIAPAGAILATNSSSIPVSRMAERSGRPELCLNIHFTSPMQGNYMVDVMGGTKTTPAVLETGLAWVRSLGCLPLTVKKEIPGFCFNRVWRAIKKETLFLWANDYADFRDIDRGWMVFSGMKYGPFGLMDTVGLDVVYDIEMFYYNESKDPKDHPPERLKQKIERGELGAKTGKGFYTYPNPEYQNPDFLSP